MRILVIGSGGREHAICNSFARSPHVTNLFCAPGNAGIAQIAECVPVTAEDVSSLVEFAHREQIDLTFVGGEGPLALGIVDEFESRGLRIIGASKDAARLEASKAFAKEFMLRHGIPTAMHRTAGTVTKAIEILESGTFGGENAPVVVKADGLAAGKGVIVAGDRAEAIAACIELASLVGSDAVSQIVLEEFLDGREVSLIMFADGCDFALMPPVRDHKRIGEGDTGPNTGGMGTITDAALLTPEETQTIIEQIIKPTLHGCIEEGFPFRGILFLGLMMIKENVTPRVREDVEQENYITAVPKVLEYNVRFGDPETQSILVRLESDLVEICESMLQTSNESMTKGSSASAGSRGIADSGGITGSTSSDHGGRRLRDLPIRWRPGNSACIVLAAEGYPHKPRTGDTISGLDEACAIPNVTVFHAGTSANDGKGSIADSSSAVAGPGSSCSDHATYVTAGGRVLGVTAVGDGIGEALATAYAAVEKISWSGMQYRRDIGK